MVIPTTLTAALLMKATMPLVPYGGGTDLMVEGDRECRYLFLHRIKELCLISEDEEHIRIGAACTFAQIEQHPLTPPVLRTAVSRIAAPAIRNLGTIGGNVGNGSAKADSALALFVLGAVLRVEGIHGIRLIPIREFYKGRKQLDLKDEELIVEILIPKNHVGDYYHQKIGARKALAISRVSFAGIRVWDDRRIVYQATAFGAINDVIFSCQSLDHMFYGKTQREATEIQKLYLEEYEKQLNPIDGRISAEYRKKVCMNLLRGFLSSCQIKEAY